MTFEERVCSIDEVPDGEARRFDLGKISLCVVRLGDAFYALNDTCTHQKISLAEGEVHRDTLQIECWKHGSCFSLLDGAPDTLPATRPVATYELRIDGDDLLVVL